MPKHSVILTNYNYDNFVGKCIESIANQNTKDLELLIVDDGSTDKSIEVINDYLELLSCHYELVVNPNNLGQGVSWSKAIELATGEYLSFIDSDDMWNHDKLSNVEIYFDRLPAIIQHDLQVFDSNGERGLFRGGVSHKDFYNEALHKNHLPKFQPSTGLTIRADLAKKVLPIPSDFRICADGYITRTTFCYGEVITIKKSLGKYRKHSSNNLLYNENFDLNKYLVSPETC